MKNESKEKSDGRAVERIWQKAYNPCGGRPRSFNSPTELWEKAREYFQWVDDNPWQKKSANNSMGSSGNKSITNYIKQEVKMFQRPYTLYGLCAFAGICKWADFKRAYQPRDGFSEVIDAIENIVTSYQVDGALLSQFDSNLVARLNGISDKRITEITGKDGEPFQFPKLTSEQIDRVKEINESL